VCSRNGCTAPLILNLLGGGEWSASCPGHFTTGEITPDIHRTGAWVGPRTSVDTLKKRKYLVLAGKESVAKKFMFSFI
jgi:hypothetical protein